MQLKSDSAFIPPELSSPSPEFRQSSDRIGLFWWYWDKVSRRISISPGFMKVLGYTEEDFDPGEPSIFKNIHPEDIEENAKRFRKILDGEEDLYEMEFRVKDNRGEWKWYYNRGVAISRDDDGKARLVGGISLEISGQFKKLLAKLDEKEKFEFLMRNSDQAMLVFEVDAGKKIIVSDANAAALKLFGKNEEIIGQPMPEIPAKDSFTGVEGELFREVLEKGYAHGEGKFPDVQGEDRWLEYHAHLFRKSGVNQVIFTLRDLTEGRRTEAALRETELLYKSLFDAADDPIGLFSLERETVLINSAFHDTFGYTHDEFMDLGWMEVVHPEDRKLLMTMGPRLIVEGSLSLDYRAVHRDGRILFVSSKNVVIPRAKDGKDLLLSIIRDMSVQRQAMMDLEEARRRAEESDQLKSAFLANMSHEIRTPMNSIVGFSNLLVNPSLEDDARELYVNRIIRNSELLLTLISDIIDLAKIESGQLNIVYGRQDLDTIMTELERYALDEISRLDKGKVVFKKHMGCSAEMETDVVRLAQILKNLINNAIKFTQEGEVSLDCRYSDKAGRIVFVVRDTGIGVARENYDLIFDQFRQIDGSNTRSFGGTGLGLAICKNLVHLMGGEIWLESKEGLGTSFFVELPIQYTQNATGTESVKAHSRVSDLSGVNPHVMIVEDEQDSLELFRALLQAENCKVTVANNGYEALHLMERQIRPDLVFMDHQLPILSGTETMRIMKERYPGIRVVAHSAHALVGDRSRFLKEGFDDYLPKPFHREQMLEVLKLAHS